MVAILNVLGAVVLPMWLAILGLFVVATLVSFFVIGPNFPDRGATPVAGARLPWFSTGHEAQLREYHDLCVRQGRSLVWSNYMRVFMASWRWLMLVGIAVSVLAVSL
jgi:hypothetical protein